MYKQEFNVAYSLDRYVVILLAVPEVFESACTVGPLRGCGCPVSVLVQSGTVRANQSTRRVYGTDLTGNNCVQGGSVNKSNTNIIYKDT